MIRFLLGMFAVAMGVLAVIPLAADAEGATIFHILAFGPLWYVAIAYACESAPHRSEDRGNYRKREWVDLEITDKDDDGNDVTLITHCVTGNRIHLSLDGLENIRAWRGGISPELARQAKHQNAVFYHLKRFAPNKAGNTAADTL